MEGQLNPKRRCEQNVDFPGLNLLQVARGNFGAFGQRVLRQFPTHPLPAHVRAEDLDSLPFFLGNCHDILHRFLMRKMNDTYIVKKFGIPLVRFTCACEYHFAQEFLGGIYWFVLSFNPTKQKESK